MVADHNQAASAVGYARSNRGRFLSALNELLRVPSISTSPEHQGDIRMAAEWLSSYLTGLGMEAVSILPTPIHPMVYAQYSKAGQDKPTVLIYGHYDVQPPEPLELWRTPPFEPSVQGDYLFARGASDMKGQIIATLAAIESLLNAGPFPVNLKFLFEGEEEIGSPSMHDFLSKNRNLLKSDFALNPDAGMVAPDKPTITYGLRGLAYFDLRIYGPSRDLHSGQFGGAVHNPAQALAELIAQMHDAQGRVTLKGFYDRVVPLTAEERKELQRLGQDERFLLQETGVPALWGEEGYSPKERISARPTLEINGIYGGYSGPGSKTIIPSMAGAKISMRLVPEQDPEEVHQQFLEFLRRNAPKTVRWELDRLSGSPGVIVPLHTAPVEALRRALQTVWGHEPINNREGGSIPIVTDLQQVLGIPSVLTGFGLMDDAIHSPNERLHLPTWGRGIEALIHFFVNLEGMGSL